MQHQLLTGLNTFGYATPIIDRFKTLLVMQHQLLTGLNTFGYATPIIDRFKHFWLCNTNY